MPHEVHTYSNFHNVFWPQRTQIWIDGGIYRTEFMLNVVNKCKRLKKNSNFQFFFTETINSILDFLDTYFPRVSTTSIYLLVGEHNFRCVYSTMTVIKRRFFSLWTWKLLKQQTNLLTMSSADILLNLYRRGMYYTHCVYWMLLCIMYRHAR